MARETLQHVQATIRWCPHIKMIADSLTKAEVSKGNDAMASVLKNGTYRLAPETEELQLRKDDALRKLRDRRTSVTLMKRRNTATITTPTWTRETTHAQVL